ncbi:MAG: hypothetical protein M3Y53_09755 [Thermoproteota archaeon]|nr:hypothetical protein [Thermoproteota archaeon]
MHPKEYERSLFRMGTVAFILGIVIFLVSTIFHPSREVPTNHLRVFAEYAQSNIWIAAHIGQLAGGLLDLLLYSALLSPLAWLGLAATIITAGTLVKLRAVVGISLKMAVDSCR